tara:strand:- start:608 stop:1489 length:882 start_codon:yes stop_codon:yes gene_type:complete
MKKEPLIYIVILNYNNTQLTIDCLNSLYGLSYTNFKILVVDDCSTDRSIDGITTLFSQVELIINERNINYCKSFNVGIRHALDNEAEYIFLINNDTKEFSTNYLQEIIKTFRGDPSVGMVGSKCFDYDGKERRGKKASMRFGLEMAVPTEGYVIKREAFENVGLFNEWLVIYFEDLDYIARLSESGYKTAINTSISFAHLGGGTTSKVIFKSNYYRVRNMILFTKRYCKHRPVIINLNEIKGNLGVHYRRMISFIYQKDFIKAVKVFSAVFIGIIVGFFIPESFGWREKFYKL